MGTPEKALKDLGHLFMVGLPGLILDESTKRLIQDFHINNFIYFKRNVKDKQQLRRLSSDLNKACSDEGLPPPLISIDQEGGTVVRLPPPFTQFQDARIYAEAEKPEDELESFAITCVRELAEIGVNMNLAPVLDVSEKGCDKFMERRSLGDDPERASKLGRLIIEKMQSNRLAACAKHFPGLGSATVDPHLQLPFVNRSYEDLLSIDIPPFEAAINAGVAAIMTSHTIYKDIDPKYPATLSDKILTDLLRKRLHYDGLIITDDLEMGAIENEMLVEEAALKSFQAGADILLICHDHEKVIKSYNTLSKAYQEGSLLESRLEESLERLHAVQKEYSTDC